MLIMKENVINSLKLAQQRSKIIDHESQGQMETEDFRDECA